MGVHMPIQASRRWGRSRPRPQVPDRRRRSGGRGANRKAANEHAQAPECPWEWRFRAQAPHCLMCTHGSASTLANQRQDPSPESHVTTAIPDRFGPENRQGCEPRCERGVDRHNAALASRRYTRDQNFNC